LTSGIYLARDYRTPKVYSLQPLPFIHPACPYDYLPDHGWSTPSSLTGRGFDFLEFHGQQTHSHYGRGHLHFITFTCYRRLPLLHSFRARNVFVHILDQVRDRYDCSLAGYVVNPEHTYLLISEPPKGNPSAVLQVPPARNPAQLRFVSLSF
jgi:hypothetical protein